jgi:lysophospholipase L1-like esterase
VKRGRGWLSGAILAAGGLLFALGLLEAGVRWVHLVPDRFWEPDPVLGVRLIPESLGWWTQEDREFVVPVRINGHGRRDVERQFAKPPGTFRVLVLGDSFVEAMQVPLDGAFARLLERQLNGDGTARIEVVSAGVSGYGTASELLYFERVGKRYQPDLVVLAFYPGNDVKNNSPTLEDRFKPVYAADGALDKVVGEWQERRPSAWLPRLHAYLYVRQALLLRRPQLAYALARYGLVQPEAIRMVPLRDGVPVDYGVYATPLEPEWQNAWVRTERLLGELQQAVAVSGARLVIAILSTREQIYPDSWHEIVAAHPRMHGRQWDLDAPQHRVEAWCLAHDVPCAAMAPAFRAAAERGGDFLHYPREGHWTVAGHRLAAAVLQDFLEEHRLVPSRGQGVSHEIH